jgi:hypothetical protein
MPQRVGLSEVQHRLAGRSRLGDGELLAGKLLGRRQVAMGGRITDDQASPDRVCE